MAKLFTVILNERLQKLGAGKGCFKPNYSTVDASFILNSLIEKQFKGKKKLYCCFIDFQKAYDRTDRLNLWYKRIQSGVGGKLFAIIRSMYDDVTLCLKHMNSVSELFLNPI